MQDISEEFFESYDEQFFRSQLGFDASVRLQARECSSVADVIENYEFLSQTAPVRDFGVYDSFTPETEFLSDYLSMTQPHPDPSRHSTVYLVLDPFYVEDFCHASCGPQDFLVLDLRGTRGERISGCLSVDAAGLLEHEVMQSLYDDAFVQYWGLGAALDEKLRVRRGGEVQARGPWLKFSMIDLAEGGEGEPAEYAFSPDPVYVPAQ